jgi:nicotinamidase/pyrazinamidase
MPIRLSPGDVLIVIDVQRDFLPGGALAVPDGNAVIAPILRLSEAFDHVILTQDWHPPGHVSFASRHAGRRPFETLALDDGEQALWPDHCVQGTPGARIADALDIPKAELILRKGHCPALDSYSAFVEADRRTPTGLAGYLRERGLARVFCAGLATDFCVAWTALDARRAGFETVVIEDACRGIDVGGSLARAWAEMERAGAKRMRSPDILHGR